MRHTIPYLQWTSAIHWSGIFSWKVWSCNVTFPGCIWLLGTHVCNDWIWNVITDLLFHVHVLWNWECNVKYSVRNSHIDCWSTRLRWVLQWYLKRIHIQLVHKLSGLPHRISCQPGRTYTFASLHNICGSRTCICHSSPCNPLKQTCNGPFKVGVWYTCCVIHQRIVQAFLGYFSRNFNHREWASGEKPLKFTNDVDAIERNYISMSAIRNQD